MSQILVRRPCGVIRCSVPVPSLDDFDGRSRWTVRTQTGVMLRTQADLVYDAPRRAGAALVELTALEPSPASSSSRYEVVEAEPEHGFAQPGSAARAAFGGGPSFDLGEGVGLVDTSWGRWHRSGPVALSRWFMGSNIRGLAHFLDGRDVVVLDFVVHAASPGSPNLFFERVRVELPGGWVGISAWPEPLGDGSLQPLSPRPSGELWVIVQRQARPFRLVCYRDPSDFQLADALSRARDFGASDQWAELPVWLPHGLPLPRVDPRLSAWLPNLEGLANGDWFGISQALQNGTSYGTNVQPGNPARIGHFVPWGVNYGGSTGGADRELINQKGLAAALTGTPDAILALQAESAMVLFRQPTLLLEADGSAVHPERWLDVSGAPRGGWRVSAVGGEFVAGHDGAFGFAPQAGVRPGGGLSWVEAEVQQFGLDSTDTQRIDDQHVVRVWSPLVALAQLRNDALSLWALRSLSEVWRMGQKTDGNLAGELASTRALLGHGTAWGRGQGHPLSMAAATALLSDEPWRRRWRVFLRDCGEVLSNARMPNGFRRARPAYVKEGAVFFDTAGHPLHATTTPDEEVYLELAARGVELVFARQPTWPELAVAVWRQAWDRGSRAGPSDYLAVRGVARSSEPYPICSPVNGTDDAELGHAFAFALSDGSFIDYPELETAVRRLCGGGADPIGGILAKMPNPYRASLYVDDFAFLIRQLQV